MHQQTSSWGYVITLREWFFKCAESYLSGANRATYELVTRKLSEGFKCLPKSNSKFFVGKLAHVGTCLHIKHYQPTSSHNNILAWAWMHPPNMMLPLVRTGSLHSRPSPTAKARGPEKGSKQSPVMPSLSFGSVFIICYKSVYWFIQFYTSRASLDLQPLAVAATGSHPNKSSTYARDCQTCTIIQ